MVPKRIRRRTTKGWRVPEGAIYVGRPTPWGNYKGSVEAHREVAERAYRLGMSFATLRGKDLVCWCPLDQSCHADTLLDIANREESAE